MDDDGRLEGRRDVDVLAVEHLVEEVLLSHHADDLVDLAAADHDLGVLVGAQRLEHLGARVIGIDPLDLVARGHDVPDLAFADGEDAFDRLLLDLADEPGLLARLDEEVELGRRMKRALAVSGLKVEQAKHAIAEAVQEQDGRAEHQEEQAEGTDDGEGRALAPLKGQALRGEFAEDDVQGRDDRERDHHRHRVRHDRPQVHRQPGERRLDEVCEGRLADPAERQGREGDAELGRREVGIQAVGRLLQGRGVRPPLRDQLGDAAAAHRDQGELGRHEEPVGEHQDQDRKQSQCGRPCVVGNRLIPTLSNW